MFSLPRLSHDHQSYICPRQVKTGDNDTRLLENAYIQLFKHLKARMVQDGEFCSILRQGGKKPILYEAIAAIL